MTKIIFATGNEGKMREIRDIMADLDVELLSMKEAGIKLDIVEDGKTFEENALIKAGAVAKEAPGVIVMADDSGLEVDYLHKKPGIYSARFIGEDISYDIKNQAILDLLAGVPKEERTARFVCSIAAVLPDGRELVTRETMEGYIGDKIAGENGFGYDPIFCVEKYGCTTAELSEEQKNLLRTEQSEQVNSICVSALEKKHINELKEKLARLVKTDNQKLQLVGDLIHPADLVVLVIPIDKAAPKGRLILPQQQVIRDVLEADGAAICVKEYELRELLDTIGKRPAMVITDSQVFAKVSADVPEEIPLTSFSILMARYKGFLEEAVLGAAAIDRLKDGDRILISEGCTHHRQCDDIGSVKIPRWLKNYTGKKLTIETSSGREFPEDLSPFSLIIHCGGCMLNEREMKYRMKCAKDQNIPFTNYGTAIAYMQGILERSIGIFPYLLEELKR